MNENRLTLYADQREVLDGPPMYDDRGRLVCVLNKEHPRYLDHAKHFQTPWMTVDRALRLAEKLDALGLKRDLVASIILRFCNEEKPTLEVVK